MAAHGDELSCDFAQYYHILSWRDLPVPLAAVLAAGLPEEARCVRRLTGAKASQKELLLALIADHLALLVWMQTEDGQRGRNRPKSLAAQLTEERRTEKPARFASGADFEQAWARTVRKGGEPE